MSVDARTRYTKHVIKDALYEMLEDTPLEKITVSALCQRCGINRTTFYRYYDNPYDLVEKIENTVLDEIVIQLKKYENESIPELFRIVLQNVQKHIRDFYVLHTYTDDKQFRKRVFAVCYPECMKALEYCYPYLDHAHHEMLYYFMAEGANAMLSTWIRLGQPLSNEEVIEMASRCIYVLMDSLPAAYKDNPKISQIPGK